MRKLLHITIIIWGVIIATSSQADRIKDVTTLQGVRSNQLIGYGIVVGLNGTGDQINQATFTKQSFESMLNKFGIKIPPGVSIKTNNIAAVMVSADLPAFAKPGQLIDITTSSIGNAKSLRGGTLLMTPLKGADGQTYAIAQGSLIVSGFGAEGADGSKITVNVPSVGRVPNGATVEKPSPTSFSYQDMAVFNLHHADFTTAVRLAEVINKQFKEPIASALDANSIRVSLPADREQKIMQLAAIENLEVHVADAAARIIINARTGTVVIGQHVRVLPAAISHGSLTVTVSESPKVSQPQPFSLGTTEKVPDSQVKINEEDNRAFVFEPGPSLQDIVNAINSIGASPSDLVAIIDSLRQAGAIRGELTII